MTFTLPVPRLRHLAALIAFALTATAALAVPSGASALGPNLIANGDLRADSTGFTPYAGRGLPATMTWKAGGDKEPGSLSATFLDGSAGGPAWYTPEAPVAGETAYIAEVSSRGVASELLARFTISDGSYRYRTLRVLPKNSSWVRTRVRLVTPAGATATSIYQEITTPGTLETDDYALMLATAPDLSSGIPNGSLEQGDDLVPAQPLEWSGHANSNASYSVVAGRGGGKAVKVTASRFNAAQLAYWETDPVPVTPGATYQFTDWYKSDVDSRVYVEIQKADGTYRELALKTVGPSRTSFTRYQTRFLMPSYAKAAILIHVPLAKGSLTTDDYALARVDASSFKAATVSLTFDDGYASDMDGAAPALAAAGIRASFYPISGLLDQPGYLTRADVTALAGAGHEIGSHTVTHADLAATGLLRRTTELSVSKLTLEGLLGPGSVSGIASPYGSYDSSVLSAMSLAGYRYHRTLDEGLNEPADWDPMRIRAYLVLSSTTPDELQALLARAAADRTWLVLVYHAVDQSGDFYSVTPAQLEAQLAQVNASGAKTLPVREALAVLTPQVPKTSAAISKRSKARKKAFSRRHATPVHRPG